MSAKTMPTQCHDIETLLPTYLDGELAAHDHLSFEHHMADCVACRDRVMSEGAYRARVRELLAPPPPPDGLAAKVRQALDAEDAQARVARRRFGRSWALPATSVCAAAAALVLFLSSQSRSAQVAEDHGGESRGLSSADRSLRLALSSSGLGPSSRGQGTWQTRTAQVSVVRSDGRLQDVSLQVVKCRGLDLRGHEHVRISGAELWLGRRGPLNVITHDFGNGGCVVVTSDMEPDLLLSWVMQLLTSP
jgi:anti-sigma factor RsiW